MATSMYNELNDALFQRLQKEHFVLFATVDHETGGPNVNAISWVHAPSRNMVRVAVGHKSRIVDNIKKNGLVNLTLIVDDTVHTISGNAVVAADAMEGVSIKLAKIEVSIDAVREVMFYGAAITQEPTYVKTMDVELAEKLDKEVLQAIKA